MNSINPLFFVNVLVGLTLAVCVAFVAYGRDRNLTLWSCAFSLYPLALGLFGFRENYPFWVSIVFGNTALIAMFALFSEGLCRLCNLKLSRLWVWLPTPLGVGGMVLLQDNYSARLVLGVLLTVYYSVLMLYVVYRSIPLDQGRGRWLIYAAAVLSSVLFLTRATMVALGSDFLVDFSTPGVPQTLLLSLGMVWLIMFSIGLLERYKEVAENALMNLAQRDPLTQLGNRRVLQERLSAAYQTSRKQGLFGAFMMLDLDLFKELNDTYGHALGDQLLMEVAYRLKDSVNDSDTIVRLGGDEFVLLIEGLDSDRAQALNKAHMIADRVWEKLQQPYSLRTQDTKTVESDRVSYTLSVSIGVDLFIGDGKSKEALFRNADRAMYHAKSAGRNRIVFHSEKDSRLVGVA